jgi:hypothetical protein
MFYLSKSLSYAGWWTRCLSLIGRASAWTSGWTVHPDATLAHYLAPHPTTRICIQRQHLDVALRPRALLHLHPFLGMGPITCPPCECAPQRRLLATGACTVTHDAAPSISRQLSASHRRHWNMCSLRSTFETLRWNTCNIHLKQMKHLEYTFETCV